MRILNSFAILCLLCILTTPGNGSEVLLSPNARIAVTLNLHVNPRPYPDEVMLYYSVSLDGDPLLQDSPLSLEFEESGVLGENLRMFGVQRRSGDELIPIPFGSQDTVRHTDNEITLSLQEKEPPFRLMKVVFRATNQGVAFFYSIPEQGNLQSYHLSEERSGFNFVSDFTAYTLPLPSYATHYEANYEISPVSQIQTSTLIGCPLLLDTGRGPWIAITEARLREYSGMYLKRNESFAHALQSSLSPRWDDPSVSVKGKIPFRSPWRVLLIGDDAGDLVESNLVYCLNDPSVMEDHSWIKPGKCAWPWWSGRHVEDVPFQGGMNTETMLHYLDAAVDHGFEFLLIDASWYGAHNQRQEDITTPIPEVDLPRILQVAKEKGVGLILWLFWECVQDQMDRAFPLYESWGVAGVKIDYMNRDDQDMVDFYEKTVRKAAEHHLIVNYHGAYKPTGIRRTFPNLITREGLLGMEHSKWSDHCNPEHELLIPFTRMLAGPMDFTPGCFRPKSEKTFNHRVQPPEVQGTLCHQLAMYVVYESPLQMCVDYPAAYRAQNGVSFLESVPTVWDTSLVLDGQVGDYIIMIRRQAGTWYVGAMTDWTARTLQIPLHFLGDGNFQADTYADMMEPHHDPAGMWTQSISVMSADTLHAHLGPGGGFTARITPREQGEEGVPEVNPAHQRY